MRIISTFLTVQAQPSPQFHVEAWLPIRNREMDYLRRFTISIFVPIQSPIKLIQSISLRSRT